MRNRIINTNIKTKLSLLFLMIGIAAAAVLCSGAGVRDWNDQQIRDAFDEVARNYGACEYATYTFMVEFGRAPHSLQELRDTGHLNVKMINPYSGGEVISLTKDDVPDGVLMGNILVFDRDEGREAREDAYYVRNGKPPVVHSMIKRIWIYKSSLDHGIFFENELPRDEQMTAVYTRQALDALDSFQQKIGSSPENFEDMYTRGDVNVHYMNPVTGELAKSSETLSAGDFYYKKIGDEGYILVGWGRERPVFLACTDETVSEEFFKAWPGLEEQVEVKTEASERTKTAE